MRGFVSLSNRDISFEFAGLPSREANRGHEFQCA